MMSQSAKFAYSAVGEVVTASVMNPKENPYSVGKARPFVLVYREGSRWFGMGLTTKSSYLDGSHRTPVPLPEQMGLRPPSYLWGDRFTAICVMDVHNHIGWTSPDLATLIITRSRLTSDYAASLIWSTARNTAAA